MFVVIYTLGPAWQTVKTVTELPFFREHIRYMQQVFAAGSCSWAVLSWTLKAAGHSRCRERRAGAGNRRPRSRGAGAGC